MTLIELVDAIIPRHSKNMTYSELKGICKSHGYVLPRIQANHLPISKEEQEQFWWRWIRYYEFSIKRFVGDDDDRDEFLNC